MKKFRIELFTIDSMVTKSVDMSIDDAVHFAHMLSALFPDFSEIAISEYENNVHKKECIIWKTRPYGTE